MLATSEKIRRAESPMFFRCKRFGAPNLRGFSDAKDSARRIFSLAANARPVRLTLHYVLDCIRILIISSYHHYMIWSTKVVKNLGCPSTITILGRGPLLRMACRSPFFNHCVCHYHSRTPFSQNIHWICK
jgi:hypothetical protein